MLFNIFWTAICTFLKAGPTILIVGERRGFPMKRSIAKKRILPWLRFLVLWKMEFGYLPGLSMNGTAEMAVFWMAFKGWGRTMWLKCLPILPVGSRNLKYCFA